jgi:hypothetical protein
MDDCPECGVPIDVLPAGLPLHRNSFGKRCPASGKSLTLLRHIELLRAIFGQRRG